MQFHTPTSSDDMSNQTPTHFSPIRFLQSARSFIAAIAIAGTAISGTMMFGAMMSGTMLGSGAAFAADLYARPAAKEIAIIPVSPFAGWEVRAGGLAHNPFFKRENSSADLNLEILTPRLYDTGNYYYNLLIPRGQAGTTLAFASRHTSLYYGGFAWTYEPIKRVFLEATLGAAAHDGYTGQTKIFDGRAELGCSPLIHTSGSVGYRLTDNWNVMATFEHVSNGGICGRNQGLTHVGGRVGYRF